MSRGFSSSKIVIYVYIIGIISVALIIRPISSIYLTDLVRLIPFRMVNKATRISLSLISPSLEKESLDADNLVYRLLHLLFRMQSLPFTRQCHRHWTRRLTSMLPLPLRISNFSTTNEIFTSSKMFKALFTIRTYN